MTIQELRLADIISALSFALDLTEGAVAGHALRTTLIGMRLAVAIELPEELTADLFFSLQLKDVGCSSNAARVCQIFAGDDRTAKSMSKLTDWTGLMRGAVESTSTPARLGDLAAGVRAVPRNLRMLWSVVEPEKSLRQKFHRVSELARNTEVNTREVITLRCDRGAEVLRKLRMSATACSAVHSLDERWDGKGYPDGLAGEAISVLARIAAVAQHLDAFSTSFGAQAAMDTLRRRSGTWFDPDLVAAARQLHRRGTLWDGCRPGDTVEQTRAAVLRLAPLHQPHLQPEQIDDVCEAFADVVDAKSPFTYRHSVGVTETVVALGSFLGLAHPTMNLLRRAALLHDVGKLGVSNTILDKPGKLTDAERQAMMAHPAATRAILQRIPGFEDLVRIAGQHHEKLDGSGYPDGLGADELSLEARLLTLADCYTALAEERPYRKALPPEKIFQILRQDAPAKLDGDLLAALEALVVSGRLPAMEAGLRAETTMCAAISGR